MKMAPIQLSAAAAAASATSLAMALCILSAAASASAETALIGRSPSSSSSSFHRQSAFVTTTTTTFKAAIIDHRHRRPQRGTSTLTSTLSRRTRLIAANGGMDDYDAQMKTMGGRLNQQQRQHQQAATPFASKESNNSNSNNNMRPGQNSCNQQVLQEHETDNNVGDQLQQQQQQQQQYAQQEATATVGQIYSQSQTSLDSNYDSNSGSNDEDYDPYEMQFANYLLSLQQQMEQDETNGETNASFSTSIMEQSEDYNEKQQSQQSISQPSSATRPPTETEAATNNDEAQSQHQSEEEIYDKFLQMVSSEIQYKKLINQSPYSLTDIEISVLIQRFLDNLEDGTQKNNGKFKGQDKFMGRTAAKQERKTVVVLGTGWAAHTFAKLASTHDLRIVIVSPVNHFVFTPMLASAAVGTVEYRSMTEPIRVTNPYIDNFVEGRAIGVDVERRVVQVQLMSMSTVTGAFKGIAANAPCRLEPEPVLTRIEYSDDEEGSCSVRRDKSQGAGGVIELTYDHLICAVGTASRSSMVPGAKECCFNLKTSQDSKRLRTAIGEALELASRPDVQEFYYPEDDNEAVRVEAREERRRRVRIAVVGGGPTGVELCGELCDFFGQVCSSPDGAYQALREDVEIMLIHGGSELLPSMDQELRERAFEALRAQGVDVRLNTRLKEVGLDYIRIGEKGSDVMEEETIPLGITVWAAGNAPVPFVKDLLSQLPESAKGSGGRINVDRWLRCPTPTPDTFGSILVLGDVACFESQYKYDECPAPLPQTAQVAGQQGAFVARMLNRGYDTGTTPPRLPELNDENDAFSFSLLRVWLVSRGLEEAPGFNFLSLGLLAYVGQEEALNQVMVGNVPLFNYSGKVAFALWRSVYLAKQASSRNQALIAFDWLRTEAFGRDITRL